MRHLTLLGVCALAVTAASGAVTLFDFETPAEIAAAPKGTNASRAFAVEERYATSGSHALHWTCTPWRKGLDEWPSFTLKPSVTDWTKYDRLCVDLINLDEGGDVFSTFIAGPEGRIQNGLSAGTRLPAWGHLQWIVPLKDWPQTAPATNIARVHFFTDRARSFNLYLDRVTLLEKGETPPAVEGTTLGRDLLALLTARGAELARTQEEVRRREVHAESYWRFRLACQQAGQDTAQMSVGLASSMEKVRPRGAFTAQPAREASVRLARYEKESLQVIVAPGETDLADVRVTCGDLTRTDGAVFAASNVACAVTGYVETKNRPPYQVGYQAPSTNAVGYCRQLKTPELGWWPDPILDYLHATPVKGRDAQSFWVRVTCPEDQSAGTYRGALTVTAKTADGRTFVRQIPFAVRVNDFSVPKRSPLPLAIAFWPGPNVQLESEANLAEARRLRADPSAPVNAWRKHAAQWGDFLADYYITLDSIYHAQNLGEYPHFDIFQRLKDQGRLDVFNLGYWNRVYAGPDGEKAWRADHLPRLKANWEKAKALGMGDRCFIYGCDEAPQAEFPQIRRAVEILKEELPGVPIFTTAYDHEFGVGTELSCMDWFTPLTPRFDPEKAAAARKEGRQVWWYICCGPKAPYANMFIEHAAIEGRLLMGAQTVRMRPDGFLYYAISIWNAKRPIAGTSAFTDWDPRSWTTFHGDGSWTCCGPDGTPLATQRLENFRDGLEDLAYAQELERRLAAAGTADAAWAAQARALLAVPKDVMDTMDNYTDDPATLLKWRDAMAGLIETAPGGK